MLISHASWAPLFIVPLGLLAGEWCLHTHTFDVTPVASFDVVQTADCGPVSGTRTAAGLSVWKSIPFATALRRFDHPRSLPSANLCWPVVFSLPRVAGFQLYFTLQPSRRALRALRGPRALRARTNG